MVSLYSSKKPAQNKIKRKAESLPERTSIIAHAGFVHESQKGTPRCTRLPGVFTLEAAIIIPLTACFFVSILFFFRVMQVQLQVQKALDDTGRKLAVYQTAHEESAGVGLAAAELLFLREMTGREEAKRYIRGGSMGISLIESKFTEDEISLKACYHIRLPVKIFWVWDFAMMQQANCRKWTGWNADGGNGVSDDWVYITETGTVYHITKSCTHLRLSIRTIDAGRITELRNENGGRYYRCTQCATVNVEQGRVYITSQGNRYHTDLDCSGIKRTVYMVRLSEAAGRTKCSRCGESSG